ncbi:LOW QUALITY PROTEIN: protocadherin gamma-A3-like [Columba livia]|uniref:LOW QUALITY PROTEIN: protocadherin gamma-A3-like n=1 Tax=Columba livia TaxID=8932 RepID=UPI0031B9BF3C
MEGLNTFLSFPEGLVGENEPGGGVEYNVTVRTAEGGSPALWSSAVLWLRVLDVNDNAPVFAEARYSARVPENNAAGALVLRVRAWDTDWGQNARVRYRLGEGRVRGAPLSSSVSVEAETGALYPLRSFDYEEVREVGLWMRAEDGSAPALSSNVSVRLVIVDENDNAPQVLYPPAAPLRRARAAVVELAPRSAEPGALVAKVVVVDADAGQNAWLSYELTNGTEPGLFRVLLHSGEVRTAGKGAERDVRRQMLVMPVRDRGQPPPPAAPILASRCRATSATASSSSATLPGAPAHHLHHRLSGLGLFAIPPLRSLLFSSQAVSGSPLDTLFTCLFLLLVSPRIEQGLRGRHQYGHCVASLSLRSIPVQRLGEQRIPTPEQH